MMNYAATLAASPTPGCTVNGQPVPCDQALDHFGTFFFGFGLLFFFMFVFIFLVATVGLVLTIVMIVHAAQNGIKDRTLWIVLMVLLGPIAALIYYFAVKRPFDAEAESKAVSSRASSRKPRRSRPRKRRSSR